jgi:hypothetical protein
MVSVTEFKTGVRWLPRREQDFADFCLKWKAVLEDPANGAVFGWDPAEVAGTLARIEAFLAARAAYTREKSGKNRLVKAETRDAAEYAMDDFASTFIRHNKLLKVAAD